MSDDTILIITNDPVVTELPDGRPLAPRLRGTGPRIHERRVDEVKASMTRFLGQMSDILAGASALGSGYAVDTVEVNAELTGEGKVGFLGSGASVGGSAGFKIVFRRVSAGGDG